MTLYLPASEDLPIFNTSVFQSNTATLTTTVADKRYLKYPQSQGSELFNTDITVNGKIHNVLLDASLNKVSNFYIYPDGSTHCGNSFWVDQGIGIELGIWDLSGNHCPTSYLTNLTSDPETRFNSIDSSLNQVSNFYMDPTDGTTHCQNGFWCESNLGIVGSICDSSGANIPVTYLTGFLSAPQQQINDLSNSTTQSFTNLTNGTTVFGTKGSYGPKTKFNPLRPPVVNSTITMYGNLELGNDQDTAGTTYSNSQTNIHGNVHFSGTVTLSTASTISPNAIAKPAVSSSAVGIVDNNYVYTDSDNTINSTNTYTGIVNLENNLNFCDGDGNSLSTIHLNNANTKLIIDMNTLNGISYLKNGTTIVASLSSLGVFNCSDINLTNVNGDLSTVINSLQNDVTINTGKITTVYANTMNTQGLIADSILNTSTNTSNISMNSNDIFSLQQQNITFQNQITSMQSEIDFLMSHFNLTMPNNQNKLIDSGS